MYSVMLMAAMTTSGNAPDFWLHRGWSTGHGCAGWSSGHRWCAGYSAHGCTGCGHYAGGIGGYGGWYGVNWMNVGGNMECWGGHGCYGCGGYLGCSGYASATGAPGPETIPAPRVDTASARAAAERARLTVQVPPGAKLFIDDQPMKAASDVRNFNTPRLERGQAYYYEVRAEVVRDGKPVSETKKVVVRAGEDVAVSFRHMEVPAVADVTRKPREDTVAEVSHRRGR